VGLGDPPAQPSQVHQAAYLKLSDPDKNCDPLLNSKRISPTASTREGRRHRFSGFTFAKKDNKWETSYDPHAGDLLLTISVC
jgi:hypothetical protein